jgi:MFS family permease
LDARRNSQRFAAGGKPYNIGYILALFMTVSIGTIQFGYSIGSWNTGQKPFENIKNWGPDKSEITLY